MKRGPLQIGIAIDELVNAILDGDARHTISARAGYAAYRGKAWAKVAVPIIEAIFGAGHCAAQAHKEGLMPKEGGS